jgi:hypothetical protein
VIIGNIIPVLILIFSGNIWFTAIAAALSLIGIYITEKIWVEAPQRIPLA